MPLNINTLLGDSKELVVGSLGTLENPVVVSFIVIAFICLILVIWFPVKLGSLVRFAVISFVGTLVMIIVHDDSMLKKRGSNTIMDTGDVPVVGAGYETNTTQSQSADVEFNTEATDPSDMIIIR